MAFKMISLLLALLFTLCILLSVANEAAAGRSVLQLSKEVADAKQPDWLVHHHHDLLHYNPITGSYSGTGHIPIGGRIRDRTPRTYIPGGDDTLIPNPGFEIPIPGRGPRPPVTGNPP